MNITIAKPSLQEALSIASKCLGRDVMTSGVLVTAGDGSATFQSTDDRFSVRHVSKARVEDGGAAVLPCKMLLDTVKAFPDQPVTITTTNYATVECGGSRLECSVLDPDHFPSFPEVVPGQSVELPTDLLRDMASTAARSTSDADPTRPYLSGICVRVRDGLLSLYSTDQYRMTRCRCRLDGSADFDELIPASALVDAVSVAGGETVSVGVSERQSVVSSGDTTVVSSRIGGAVPSYEVFILSSYESRASLDPSDLAASLKRMRPVTAGNPVVRMFFGDDLTMEALAQGVGHSTETVPAVMEGEPKRVALNSRYLADLPTGGELTVGLCGELAPVAFESWGDFEYLQVMMPVRWQ